LPEAFTDYKGVTKSHNPAANVPERVEIPTQELPNENKRGRGTATKDKAIQKPPRKTRKVTSTIVNADQHQVYKHQLDIIHPNNMDAQQVHHVPSTTTTTTTTTT
jgi:hypothetical protein